MRTPSCLHLAVLAALPILLITSAHTQPPKDDLSKRLINRPLYIRDAWLEDKIEFNATGKPQSQTHRGPLPMSGIDITSVKASHTTLQIRGQRAILIAGAPGHPLKRTTGINSTTRIVPSLRKGDARFFKAYEDIQFTIHADSNGSFDPALTRIFADGLAQLAATVPSYWKCYAASYFVDEPISPASAADVEHCAENQSAGAHLPSSTAEGGFSPVAVVRSVPPAFTPAARSLGLSGISKIYVTIQANGQPSEFQVIEPLGAGLDEEAMQATSQFVFQPATQNGKPIPAGIVVQTQYAIH